MGEVLLLSLGSVPVMTVGGALLLSLWVESSCYNCGWNPPLITDCSRDPQVLLSLDILERPQVSNVTLQDKVLDKPGPLGRLLPGQHVVPEVQVLDRRGQGGGGAGLGGGEMKKIKKDIS